MNENLDLTELLKDCPKGTKFYSSYLGRDVFFIGIHNNYIECEYPSKIDSPFNSTIQFRKEGSFFKEGECMLFPSKYQRDWSKWQRPFVDGDIITYMFYGKPTIYIYRENGEYNTSYYVAYSSENNKLFSNPNGALSGNRGDLKFATEEEKQKLFDAIKANGYKWNAETKTLKNLIVPKFKVGDIIQNVDKYKVKITEVNLEDEFYGYESLIAKLIGGIRFDNENDWKLVINKFDINTLKPFDKVLVRNYEEDSWIASYFSHSNRWNTFSNYTTIGLRNYCIPYNYETAHLIGTNKKAPEYYRYWED